MLSSCANPMGHNFGHSSRYVEVPNYCMNTSTENDFVKANLPHDIKASVSPFMKKNKLTSTIYHMELRCESVSVV